MKDSLYINPPVPTYEATAHPESWRCSCGAVVPWDRDRHFHYELKSLEDYSAFSAKPICDQTVTVDVYFRPSAREALALDRPVEDPHLKWLPPDWSAPREGEKD